MRWWLLCPLVVVAGCAPKQAGKAVSSEAITAAAPAFGAVVETVTYRAGPETLRGILCRPAGEARHPAVIIVHGDFGLSDWVKETARQLAGAGYLSLAVDLYRGQAVTDVLDAHIMDRGLSEDRVITDLRAAVDYLEGRPDVRKDAIGILGWDTGGGYALDAALNDSRLRVVVTCCGRLTTDPALLAPLNASVLGLFAGQDEGISPQTIAQFRAAMEKAGKRLAGLHVYPACGHGFMDPSTTQTTGDQVDEARVDAWRKIQYYLASELKTRFTATQRGARAARSPLGRGETSRGLLNRRRPCQAASAELRQGPARTSGVPSSTPRAPG
jgi:carboxymethylenebutenolidase